MTETLKQAPQRWPSDAANEAADVATAARPATLNAPRFSAAEGVPLCVVVAGTSMLKARVFMQRYMQEHVRAVRAAPGPSPQVLRYQMSDGEALVVESGAASTLALAALPFDDVSGRDRLLAELRPQHVAVVYFAEPQSHALVERHVALLHALWPQARQFWVAGGEFGVQNLLPAQREPADFVRPSFDDARRVIDRCVGDLVGGSNRAPRSRAALLDAAIRRLLQGDAAVAVAVVDIDTGLPLAHGGEAADLVRLCAPLVSVLRTRRRQDAADPTEDVLVITAAHYQMARPLPHYPSWCLYSASRREVTSLALARVQLADVANELTFN